MIEEEFPLSADHKRVAELHDEINEIVRRNGWNYVFALEDNASRRTVGFGGSTSVLVGMCVRLGLNVAKPFSDED